MRRQSSEGNFRLQTILRRRSIRRYTDKPVPRSLIERTLEAAIWAPSAHNRQPWRFAVVTEAGTRALLAEAMASRLRRDLEADGVDEAAIVKDTQRSYARISSAPVVIMVCLTMTDMDVYPDAGRSALEYHMAGQSTAMAGMNLLLAAYESGLGACWMCAPLFCPDVARTVLALPEDWQPQGLITMGYPAESREKTRHPLEKTILWR
ncbi:MAG: nitroreductase family protein [Chloroflexi bacterium]|nr:nitroreductase family protein [Chloroflexota bacterium]